MQELENVNVFLLVHAPVGDCGSPGWNMQFVIASLAA
jgi:hypothetical protein